MTILTSISTSLLKMNINFCQFSFLLKIVIFSIQRPMISFRKPTLFLLVTSGSSEELRPSMSWILSKIDHILRIENNHSTLIYVKNFFSNCICMHTLLSTRRRCGLRFYLLILFIVLIQIFMWLPNNILTKLRKSFILRSKKFIT